jgi:hypothetical protein
MHEGKRAGGQRTFAVSICPRLFRVDLSLLIISIIIDGMTCSTRLCGRLLIQRSTSTSENNNNNNNNNDDDDDDDSRA